MRVLVVNAGSSGLKLSVVGAGERVEWSRVIPVQDQVWDEREVERALAEVGVVDAVGHRVVHGGGELTGPVRLDARVMVRLRDLGSLAPLHQPRSLAGIEVVERVLPEVPAVACGEGEISAEGSRVRTWVVRARKDVEIVRGVRRVLG